MLGQNVIQSEAKNLGNIHVVVTEILRFALNDIKSLFISLLLRIPSRNEYRFQRTNASRSHDTSSW